MVERCLRICSPQCSHWASSTPSSMRFGQRTRSGDCQARPVAVAIVLPPPSISEALSRDANPRYGYPYSGFRVCSSHVGACRPIAKCVLWFSIFPTTILYGMLGAVGLCGSFANPFAGSSSSHDSLPFHTGLSRRPFTRPLLTQGGHLSRTADGFTQIKAPTPYVWIIGRTKTDGPADYDAVHKVQAGYKITPLSQWGKEPVPPVVKIDPAVDMKTSPKVTVDTIRPVHYFARAAELLKLHPHTSPTSQSSRVWSASASRWARALTSMRPILQSRRAWKARQRMRRS